MNHIARGLAAFLLLAAISVPAVAGDVVRVDINKASVEELDRLPGIGPALAQRIVEFRKEHGDFKKVEELLNVRGIGAKSFEPLRDKVMVGESSKTDTARTDATKAEAAKTAKAETTK